MTCPHCGKDHPQTEHMLAFARGEEQVEPGTFRLELDLREGTLLSLALKNMRAVAEEGGDEPLAKAARALELKSMHALERDVAWKPKPGDAEWKARIELASPHENAPDRAMASVLSADGLPNATELASAYATTLLFQRRAAAEEPDPAHVRRVLIEIEAPPA